MPQQQNPLPYRRRSCELMADCQQFHLRCVDCPRNTPTRTPRQEFWHWVRFAGICLAITLLGALSTGYAAGWLGY